MKIINTKVKTKTIQKAMRISKKEQQFIKKQMEELNIINFSKYARLKMLSDENILLMNDSNDGPNPGINKVEYDFVIAINKIGVNLNQITKVMNEQWKIDQPTSTNELDLSITKIKELLISIKNEMLYSK
jgi:hypothetical protein